MSPRHTSERSGSLPDVSDMRVPYLRRMGKRIALVLMAVAGVSALVLPPATAAPPPPTSGVTAYTPPFVSTQDWSRCDDGGDTAVCEASATVSTSGSIATDASLRPVGISASGGRAEGFGGPQISHRLGAAYSSVRYSFFFEGVAAAARKEPAVARDIEARAFAAGFVNHPRCPSCVVEAATLVADADPLTLEPAGVTGRALRVDVEMRNSAGKVPKGLTIATGYLLSDVGRYGRVSKFTSSAQVEISGRLVRVEVVPVP